MLNLVNLQEVLALHDKAFALLRWVSHQMQGGSLDVSRVHANMSAGAAAEDWLRHNIRNLPAEFRPDERQVRAFANLFASYLHTSFEIGRRRATSSCGCYCSFCAYLSNAPRLKARSLPKKAHETAATLKGLYLQGLAHDVGLAVTPFIIDELASANSPLAREVAMATYAKELLRRTEYFTQGEGVYSLWRQFAWANGHPDRQFKLTAEIVERSQSRIIAAMKKRLAKNDGLVQ